MHASTHDVLMGFHIVAVMAWMAGQLYLPRLYVYHSKAAVGSEMDQTFQVMEQKLLRIIMNPAMILAWILGLSLIWYDGRYLFGWGFLATPWMLTKLAGVVFMSGWHGFLSAARRRFAAGQRPYSEKFWRMTNELPFLVLIVMVLAITTKFTFG
ncbi:CopD family protein [Caulobacter sp. KR2-114]|uniref:CopD family protein n=1 Tax=Caulobacter sp. KR2-114 TaxID=3400912 RepID=UPI003C03E1F6